MKKSKNKIDWTQVRALWQKYAPQYWWGDPLDVRFYLCRELNAVKNKRILDIGCNTGIILNCADDSNVKEGFDLDTESIAIAKKMNKELALKAHFYVEDAFKAKNRQGVYDIVLLVNMIEMFPPSKRKKIIENASGLLKKGGTLYLTTPNGENRYYEKKSKLKMKELESLLKKQFTFSIGSWNPFPIASGHLLKYMPGWMNVLESKMQQNKSTGVSFYVKAIKI